MWFIILKVLFKFGYYIVFVRYSGAILNDVYGLVSHYDSSYYLDYSKLVLPLSHVLYLFIGFFLFFVALLRIGFSNSNLLLVVLGLETLMLACIVIVLMWFEMICKTLLITQDFTIFLVFLAIVVSESAIGLTIIMLLSRNIDILSVQKIVKLKG